MPFLDDDFLLTNDTAARLYHGVAAHQPIYDYHCHLNPADLAANRVYNDLTEIWLEGDHYKWRAMRANGIEETYITGDAEPYDKFLAWARTVPATLRNPLYHWTHLELRRYFGIDTLLNEDTAPEIWDEANRQLKTLDTHAILDKFKVALIGTTDDPADALDHHAAIGKLGIDTTVVPTWRPDKALAVGNAGAFNAYIDQLGADTDSIAELREVIRNSHQRFHAAGARLSDHGLRALPDADFTPDEVETIYEKVRSGENATPHETDQFVGYLMQYFATLNAERNWTMQLHLGPLRNVNTGLFNQLGPDVGCDSIGDDQQSPGLVRLLGTLSAAGKLPRTILYNINPNDNYLFATMAGNFAPGNGRGGRTRGGMQFGSGWWFLDQKHGMIDQLNALSNLGLLSHFVGMLTDSRSMMSYPRHEYFRRILCNLIGTDVEHGELPDDAAMLEKLVADVCFNNAKNYFGIELKPRYSEPVVATGS